MFKNQKTTLFLLVLAVATVLAVGILVTYEYNKTVERRCNELYGEGNWVWIEITGNINEEFYKRNPFYIGQAWKCVKKVGE